MKTATKNLEQDHVNILRLIDVMESMVVSDSSDIAHFEKVVYLIKHYADGFHHAKEENILFPLLVQKGFSDKQGPVAAMLFEHVKGREFVGHMTEGIESFKSGDGKSLLSIYKNMQGYITLLRNHIEKEDKILFRMADNVLTPDDQQSLLKEFSKVESGKVCNGKLVDCLSMIDELESVYNLDI